MTTKPMRPNPLPKEPWSHSRHAKAQQAAVRAIRVDDDAEGSGWVVSVPCLVAVVVDNN